MTQTRERISTIATDNGWTVIPNVGTGPTTVLDVISRGDDAVVITWNTEGTAALGITTAMGGGKLVPIKAARHMGLIALREVLETARP